MTPFGLVGACVPVHVRPLNFGGGRGMRIFTHTCHGNLEEKSVEYYRTVLPDGMCLGLSMVRNQNLVMHTSTYADLQLKGSTLSPRSHAHTRTHSPHFED